MARADGGGAGGARRTSSTTDTAFVVASGTSWAEALSSVDWVPNELLVLGSSSAGTLRRVFLGTNATKIVRHSPVPVLVVPARRAL